MSTTPVAAKAGLTTIRRRRSYPHPPAAVWAALTRADLLSEWFMRTDDFTPSVGSSFTLVEEHPEAGRDGSTARCWKRSRRPA